MAQLIINIIYTFGIILLIGYSFRCIYSTLHFFHLAHAVTLTLGGYLVYEFSALCGLPFWFSVLLAILGGALIMFGAYFFLYQRGIQQRVAGWRMMVVSLGLYVVLQNVISLVWGSTRLRMQTWEESIGYELLGGYITKTQIVSILISVLLVLTVSFIVSCTSAGKRIKAVSSNPEMSAVLGLSNNGVMALSVAIGSALMAAAGIMIGADISLSPTMGFDWLLYGVVAIIIAGTGRVRYLVMGALLLATAQHLSAFLLDSKWMNATAYVILIIFLYFRPYGFSGQGLKKTEV